jgi:hypothetical protein
MAALSLNLDLWCPVGSPRYDSSISSAAQANSAFIDSSLTLDAAGNNLITEMRIRFKIASSISSGTAQYRPSDSRTSFTCSNNNSMSYCMFYRTGHWQKRRLVSVSRMDKICPPLEWRISTLPYWLRSSLLVCDIIARHYRMVFHMFQLPRGSAVLSMLIMDIPDH